MSERWSSLFPLACSGLMYVGVPRMTPESCESASIRTDRPKSESRAESVLVSRTLAGLTSRWITPW